jgi:hypothetical protein
MSRRKATEIKVRFLSIKGSEFCSPLQLVASFERFDSLEIPAFHGITVVLPTFVDFPSEMRWQLVALRCLRPDLWELFPYSFVSLDQAVHDYYQKGL